MTNFLMVRFLLLQMLAHMEATWGQAVNALGKRDPHFYAHVENAVKKQLFLFIINFNPLNNGKKVLLMLLLKLKIRHSLQHCNVQLLVEQSVFSCLEVDPMNCLHFVIIYVTTQIALDNVGDALM